MTGELLTGAFATKVRGDALPILVQLRSAYSGPNDTEVPLEGCLMIGKATADLQSVRARVEAVSLSCVLPDGTSFERPVRGYFTGADGTLGVPGRWEFRSGRWLANLLSAMGTNRRRGVRRHRHCQGAWRRRHSWRRRRAGNHHTHPGVLSRTRRRDIAGGVDREPHAGVRGHAGRVDHRGAAGRHGLAVGGLGVGLKEIRE